MWGGFGGFFGKIIRSTGRHLRDQPKEYSKLSIFADCYTFLESFKQQGRGHSDFTINVCFFQCRPIAKSG